MKSYRLAVLLITILLAAVYSTATTYTFNGVGTGSLNGTGFTDDSFTIVATSTSFTTASFSITGIGSGTFGPGYVFVNQGSASACPTYSTVSSAVGIGTTGDIFDVCNNVFATYNLGSSIALTPAIPYPVGNVGTYFGTSAGLLNFTKFSSGSFTATNGAEVPEPSSLALLSGGLLGAVTTIRRRLRK